MERADAASELPIAYQRALELAAEGRSPVEIADELGVEPEAVPALLTLAEAKLDRLLEEEESRQ